MLLRLAYDYSDPFGIGGKGEIEYETISTGNVYRECKESSYTSHQLSLAVGPVVPVGDRAEVYLAFAPFAPTWVSYKEKYRQTENGGLVRAYDMKLNGFFGNCRVLVGIQVGVGKGLKLGSEANFVTLDYMGLEWNGLEDNSFRFPNMMWNFTLRYELF